MIRLTFKFAPEEDVRQIIPGMFTYHTCTCTDLDDIMAAVPPPIACSERHSAEYVEFPVGQEVVVAPTWMTSWRQYRVVIPAPYCVFRTPFSGSGFLWDRKWLFSVCLYIYSNLSSQKKTRRKGHRCGVLLALFKHCGGNESESFPVA